jgi:hypothetical protein
MELINYVERYHILKPGLQEVGLGPSEKSSHPPPTKFGQAKNLYTKPEGLTVSCRMTWVWSERVAWYNQQILLLSRKTKTYVT